MGKEHEGFEPTTQPPGWLTTTTAHNIRGLLRRVFFRIEALAHLSPLIRELIEGINETSVSWRTS